MKICQKKDKMMNAKNYRPVAFLQIVCKILEGRVLLQLIDYLESNHLLHPSHRGFHQKHSIFTALLQMVDIWVEAMTDNAITASLILDMSAAFDIVDHEILLKKLSQLGLTAICLIRLNRCALMVHYQILRN